MKKVLLLVSVLALVLQANAQVRVNQTPSHQGASSVSRPYEIKGRCMGAETPEQMAAMSANTHAQVVHSGSRNSSVGTEVGTTVYDLQTNSSPCRRLLNDGQNVYATWTYGVQSNAFADRGTGFNKSEDGGSTWGPAPSLRIESQRVGWPNVGKTESGRLYVVTHTSSSGLNFAFSDNNGVDWEDYVIAGDDKAVWPRAATSGNTIHVVTSRQPSGTAAAPPFPDDGTGILGGLAYFRNTNNGDENSWEGPIGLPNLGAYYPFLTGDVYTIEAKGDDVAIIITQSYMPVVMYKSSDGGTTWEVKTISPLIANGWTYDGLTTSGTGFTYNFVAATSMEPSQLSDQAVTAVIDNEGKVNVWWPRMLVAKLPDSDPNWSASNTGIMFWKEGMTEPMLIPNTVLRDYTGDKNAKIDFSTYRLQSYGNIPVDAPTAGIDASGNLYVAYSAMREDAVTSDDNDTLQRLFRDIYLIKSTDQGQTWVGPYNVTNDTDMEDVFPSMALRVDGNVHLLFQSDELTGDGVSGVVNASMLGSASLTVNSMRYVKIPVGDIVTPEGFDSEPLVDLFFIPLAASQNCAPGSGRFAADCVDYPDGVIEDINIEWFPNDIVFNDVASFAVDSARLYAMDSNNNTGQEMATTSAAWTLNVNEDIEPPTIFGGPFDTIPDPDFPYLPDIITTDFGNFETITLPLNGTYEEYGAVATDDSGCDVTVTIGGDAVNTAANGTYVVVYSSTDPTGNEATLERTVVVGNGVGIAPLEEAFAINVFPNPSNGLLNVALNEAEGAATVQVFNAAGELVKNSQTTGGNVVALDLTRVPNGIYLVKVTTEKGSVVRKVTIK